MLHSKERLELAHADPFTLGTMSVEPNVRVVRNGDTTSIVEPRVMQVLVALHGAEGHILSRDDLVRLCWGGAVVGDNAIQRALSQARKIAATVGNNSFKIETIRGVGYRLVVPPLSTVERRLNGEMELGAPPGDREPGLLRAGGDRLSRRMVLGAITVAGVAGASSLLLRKPADRPSELAMHLFESGEAIRRNEDGQIATEQAIAFYRNALREAPNFALGWGALALSYCQLLDVALDEDTDQVAARASAAARRSLEFDQSNVYGRTAQTLILPRFRNWDRLRPRLEALAQEFPRDWLIPLQLGRIAADVGDHAAAAREFRRAREVAPLMPRVHASLFYALWTQGRLHEAEEVLQQARERWPRNWMLWNAKFHYTTFGGDAAAARAHVTDLSGAPFGLAPNAIDKRLMVIVAVHGGKEERAAATRAYVEEGRERPSQVRNAGTVLAGIGARGEVLDLLDGYFFGRGPYAFRRERYSRRSTAFLFIPPMEGVRSEPRFRAILQQIGLTA